MIDVLSVFVLDQPDVMEVEGEGGGVFQKTHVIGTAVSWVKLGGSKLGHEMWLQI